MAMIASDGLEAAAEFRLNFIPEGIPPRVRVHQYSKGNMMQLCGYLFYGVEDINLQDSPWFAETVRENGTVYVAYTRNDNKSFQYELPSSVTDLSLMADGNHFWFPTDEQMTEVAGPVIMTLGFDDGSDNVLWSQNFIIDVEPHPVQEA